MYLMNHPQSEHEAHTVQASRDELIERMACGIREDGTVEPLEGLRLRRASSPTELGHGVSYPALCVIAQGSKEILLGDNHYRYDPAHYLQARNRLARDCPCAPPGPGSGRGAPLNRRRCPSEPS
jgi:hypothetical protein